MCWGDPWEEAWLLSYEEPKFIRGAPARGGAVGARPGAPTGTAGYAPTRQRNWFSGASAETDRPVGLIPRLRGLLARKRAALAPVGP